MDKRTKILTRLFFGAVGALVLANYAYPAWIQPLLEIDKQISRLEKELDERGQLELAVKEARYAYRDYVSRVGSMDPEVVQNRMKKQLDDLVVKHNLANAAVVPPRRVNLDKKSQLSSMTFSLQAEGPLQSVIGLLKDVSEMPYVLAVNSPRLSPASGSSRDRQGNDSISLNMSIEVMVLPQQKMVGERFEDEKLRQPAQHVRYARTENDYAAIWQRNPFSEYSVPKPPVLVKRDPEPEPKKVTREKPDPPAPPPPVDKRWRDRDQYTLTMAMLMRDGHSKFDEVMLYNGRSKENRYIGVEQELDGGELLYVHQRGALVGREDGRFVYPIGGKLSDPIRVEDAGEYPELQLASSRIEEPAPPEPEGAAPAAGTEPEAGVGPDVPGLTAAHGDPAEATGPVGPLPPPDATGVPAAAVGHGVLLENAEDQPVDVVGVPHTGEAAAGGVGEKPESGVPAVGARNEPAGANELPPRKGSGPRAGVNIPPKMRERPGASTRNGSGSAAKAPVRRVPTAGRPTPAGVSSTGEADKAAAEAAKEKESGAAEDGKKADEPEKKEDEPSKEAPKDPS